MRERNISKLRLFPRPVTYTTGSLLLILREFIEKYPNILLDSHAFIIAQPTNYAAQSFIGTFRQYYIHTMILFLLSENPEASPIEMVWIIMKREAAKYNF